MKKSFYFALALTAGLFASCSSDELTADAPRGGIDVNDNEAVQININVDNPTQFTRGTGSVTGTTWCGQTFNLFMFERGTFNPAQYDAAEEGAEEPDMQDIYNNAVMTTTPGSSTAQQVIDAQNTIQYQYFPTIGRFAFWAYRADDAADMTEGENPQPVVKYTNANGEEAASADEATQVRIPFTIDGSQDLMIAVTNTEAAKEALMAEPYNLEADEAADYVYSAYAARRQVNPTMKFYHQLSRLQFKVKAANRQASDQADIKAEGENYIRGIKVTKVEVWSKNKGSLIAAYKGDAAPDSRIVWNDGQEWVSKADFDPAETTLTPFELKSRDSEVETADIKWYQIDESLEEAPEALLSQITEGYSLLSNTFNADAICYTSNEVDATTKEPLEANQTTFGDVRSNATAHESVWVIAVKTGDHGDADETPWSKAIVKDDVTSQLGDLEAVIPKWTGYDNTAGWTEIEKKPTAYTWEEIEEPTDPQKEAAVAADEVPGVTTSGEEGAIKKVEVGYVLRYYILSGITYNTDGADEAPDGFNPETSDGEDGNIVYTGAGTQADPYKYYKYHKQGGAVAEGKAVATPIGESMMVAPADENGYIVRFTYWRSILKTSQANDFVNRKGEAIINVKVKEGKFEPGKVYTVTAVFYPDGLVTFEDGDIEAEGNGTNDLDGDVDGDGDVTYSTEN